MNFINIYFGFLLIWTVLSIIICCIPPLRRWYFKMFMTLYGEAFEIGMDFAEKISAKFE